VFEQGLLLTVMGISGVFIFLTILVYVVKGMSWLTGLYERKFATPGAEPAAAPAAAPKPQLPHIAAAVAAANDFLKK
jgi:sodium pump decarboxylase gamma subunit